MLGLKRIVKYGLQNIIRDRFISISSVFIMTITLFIVGMSFLTNVLISNVTDGIKDKVDITVYFIKDATDEQISSFREIIEERPDVSSVEFISKESSYTEYINRHATDEGVIDGLQIINDNPFRARLSIKAKDTENLENIAQYLQQEDWFSIYPVTVIENIDYFQNKAVIERLSSVVETVNLFALLFITFLSIISFLIIFMTIRLAIFTNKDEISIMHLMGSSKFYVRGPFVIGGVVYGLAASIISLILLAIVTYLIGPITSSFFGEEFNIYDYYLLTLLYLFFIVFISGVIIGGVSSYLSTVKYLK